MSNNIESPEFWERVKQDFEASEDDHFICPASYIFLCEWNNRATQEKIREYARHFLKENLQWRDCWVWSSAFFACVPADDGSFGNYRAVRLAFLNYMVKKTKNNAEQGN